MDNHFNGSGNLNYLFFQVDPDGKQLNPLVDDGPSKALQIHLHFNGQIKTIGTETPFAVTYHAGAINVTPNPNPFDDPSWFKW